MRWLVRTAVAVLTLAPAAVAQTAPLTPPTPPGVPLAGFEMPGTPVGRPSVRSVGDPVGSRQPTVGTALPKAVDPGAKPADPFGGTWPTVDPNLVVAPFPGMKGESADFWDKLMERWAAVFAPPPPPQTKWVPGTTRRARERREREKAMLERRMRD